MEREERDVTLDSKVPARDRRTLAKVRAKALTVRTHVRAGNFVSSEEITCE